MAASCGIASRISLPTVSTSVAIVAPIGCSVSVDTNIPIAPIAVRHTVRYPHTSTSRQTPAQNGSVDPDSVTSGPPPNTASPSSAPVPATSSVAASVNTVIAANLTSSSRTRSTGTASRYRSVPRLASPAIESAEIDATATGRNSGSSRVSAASAANTPFWVIWLTKSGPSPPPGGDTLTAMISRTGTTASTAMPTQLRRRPKISHSSDRKNRVPGRLRRSTADIEARPGQRDEHLLQVGRAHLEAAHRHVRVHQCGDRLLRYHPAEHSGDRLPDGDH